MRNKMFIIINKDLEMSEGKVNAHVAHAVIDYFHNEIRRGYEEAGYTDEWVEAEILNDINEKISEFKNGGDTVIILEGREKLLKELQQKGYTTVIDAGYTEVESGSITAVNVGIFTDDNKPKEIKRCRTYSCGMYKTYLVTGYKKMINFIVDKNTDPNKIYDHLKTKYSHLEKLVYIGKIDKLKASKKICGTSTWTVYNDVFNKQKLDDGTVYYIQSYCCGDYE